MVNDGCWWLLMVDDGCWWLMMVDDGWWWWCYTKTYYCDNVVFDVRCWRWYYWWWFNSDSDDIVTMLITLQWCYWWCFRGKEACSNLYALSVIIIVFVVVIDCCYSHCYNYHIIVQGWRVVSGIRDSIDEDMTRKCDVVVVNPLWWSVTGEMLFIWYVTADQIDGVCVTG